MRPLGKYQNNKLKYFLPFVESTHGKKTAHEKEKKRTALVKCTLISHLAEVSGYEIVTIRYDHN